jgi:hypothetical protein
MTPAKIGLVLDCTDPNMLANFWSEALGYVNVGSAGQYVALMPPPGSNAPKLLLQHVAEPKVAKNRMHLDIEIPDIETEAARLTALGAQRVRDDVCSEHGTTWVLMEDPEGNEFCVCDGGAGSRPT